MVDAIAKEKAAQHYFNYITDLWNANRLKWEDSPDDKLMSNQEIANCKHVKHIFVKTRVFEHDEEFYNKVCKRSFDACNKHPVIFMGNWGQGKSSTVNSLYGKDVAKTGRHQATTAKVHLHEISAPELGKGATILLADTPGLEPDSKFDIMGMFRKAMVDRGLSPDVLTDCIVIVVAGNAQGIRSLSSATVFKWITETYMAARRMSGASVTIQPVLTHGDQIDESERDGDLSVIYDRLQVLAKEAGVAHTRAASCQCVSDAHVMKPIVVSNPDPIKQRSGFGVEELRTTIRESLKVKIQSPHFRLQWSHFLTADLEATVRDFHARHPYEETEHRLFHRTVEAMCVTHGKRPLNIEIAFPDPSWHLLPMIERRLRNEDTVVDRWLGSLLSCSPYSPKVVSPFIGLTGGYFLLQRAYVHRERVLNSLIKLLKKVK